MSSRTRPLRVALILPRAVQGGVLRGTKNIARMLKVGSDLAGSACDVVLCVPANSYPEGEFREVTELGIPLRSITARALAPDTVERLWYLAGRVGDPPTGVGMHYRDGSADLMDCDVWLVVTNRTVDESGSVLPLIPLRPVVVVPYDFLEQYHPVVLPASFREGAAATTRRADLVLVTTPQTGLDAVTFAGCRSDRVLLVPFEFDLPSEKPEPATEPRPTRHSLRRATQARAETRSEQWRRPEDPGFLWVTNSAAHKNHRTVFRAVKKLEPEGFIGRMTGFGVNLFASPREVVEPYGPEFFESWRLFWETGVNYLVRILGFLPDDDYFQQLARSRYLLHAASYDNGTFALAEAASVGVPTLSADYPQMRYLADQLGIEAHWFDPRDPDDLAEKMQEMEQVRHDLRLPPRESLERFGWQAVARPWWEAVGPRMQELVNG